MATGTKGRRFTSVDRILQKGVTRFHIEAFRLSGGRLGGRIANMPVLLLHTTGRKTGQPRTTILTYTEDDEDIVLVASNGGTPRHPTWYLNLEANPEVEVDLGGKKEKRTARTATTQEKKRLWPGITETYKGYAGYQKKTDRDIPVVILERQ
jgi:deazaflavin-dependent oxidoreductase (nitroreductase family)